VKQLKQKTAQKVIGSLGKLLDQSPDVFFWQDLQGIIQDCNKAATSLFGFKSPDGMVGKTPFDFQCPAADSAENFVKLDQQVLTNKMTLIALITDRYEYGSDIHLVKKSPIMEDGQMIGLFTHGQQISTQYTLGAMSAYLSEKYRVKNKPSKKIHILEQKENRYSLSVKEEECLFYLLYGKTVNEIANILCRSPRTIETHFRHIRDKMLCPNKSALIEKAMAYGYMNRIPQSLLSKKFILVL